MQLCYRGNKYQAPINSIDTVESGINAKFLGRTYTLRQTNYQSTSSSDRYKYRGIVYQK
ncbi:DUF4278 domain-containing protein [Pleurocapsa sp. PCC 7319]|uniref:DUF4278 domain-containing protein n=1 Tax=Pleurocapsa sp. PCC 7319 TaxID=118161 RepID=UPI00034A03BD|nr:DUF4278 domain-containing protein [Pleurocapsa sp. PCC 7319]